MSLVTSEKLLLDAQKNNYAIGAFNVENMEMVMAVIDAAISINSPVILQTTPSTVKYAGLDMLYKMVKNLADKTKIPIALHLDHGNSYELAADAISQGYTSIMIDGSQLDFEENIRITKKVVKMCRMQMIPIEAELGKVGGKEDDLESNACYTDPLEAVEFVKRTDIDSLAVAIGTAHGFYKGTPVLKKDILTVMRNVSNIPLVLHGASGISDDEVRDCIKKGICKVNFATELRVAFTDGIKNVLKENPNVYDPKELGKAGYYNVRSLVVDRMKVCGCAGRAI